MGIRKLKYLTIFLLPLTVIVAFLYHGWLTFLPILVFFVVVPLLEHLLPPAETNLTEQERLVAQHDPFFNLLIYAMVPVQLFFVGWYLVAFNEIDTAIDLIGRTLALGVMCGVIGINVGHELGHRLNRGEQFLGEILLLTSLENHFLPYHNRGHHTNVATPSDPATARKNEPVFLFWFRSHFGSYKQAWQIECQRMVIMGKGKLNFSNRMVIYTISQCAALLLIFFAFGLYAMLGFFAAAVVGILLLETVNYIEHYGLLRKQRENGTYESVKRMHSWNSNHVIGRVVLFELSRHSDHHFKADRPYQLLENHDESPVMPTGYPGMMLLSLVPPLFFRVMNKRISAQQSGN
jgi:alkane 1-monooxygenase